MSGPYFNGTNLDTVSVPLIAKWQIDARLREIGKDIKDGKPPGPIGMLIVMTGGMYAGTDLSRLPPFLEHGQLKFQPVAAHSYHAPGVGPRAVEHNLDSINWGQFRGSTLYIVDDLIDTGGTMATVLAAARANLGPAAVIRTVVVVTKVDCQTHPIAADYCGFSVTGSPWLSGYGMDTDDFGRQRSEIRASVVDKATGRPRLRKPLTNEMPVVTVGRADGPLLHHWVPHV